MNKKNAIIFAVIASCIVFTSFSPSLDGRAVVADKDEFPAGIFAKTVGYLPGDTILVSNLALERTVDILVVGALDPSEGIAILLSHEAALALGIEKDANVIVKITKRAGQLDETVAGTAVLTEGNARMSVNSHEQLSVENEVESFTGEMTGAFAENPHVDSAILNLLADSQADAIDEIASADDNSDALPDVFEETRFVEAFIDAPVYDTHEEVAATGSHDENEIVAIDTLDDIADISERIAVSDEALADERVTDEPMPLEVVDEFAKAAPFDEAVDSPQEDGMPAEQIAVERMEPYELVAENAGESLPDDERQRIAEFIDEDKMGELFSDEVPDELTTIAEVELFAEDDAIEDAGFEVAQTTDIKDEAGDELLAEESYSAIVLDEQIGTDDELAVQGDEANYALVEAATPAESAVLMRAPLVENSFSKYVIASLERGKYYVQIAAFADDSNISATVKKYETSYPLALLPLSSGSATQVMIGPLGVDEYGAVLERFKSYGYTDAFLRKAN
ncbi:MAG: hypothetical protein J6I73_06790 [Treponema sp.]|nr:hypothetical protein [Treponema sp.]